MQLSPVKGPKFVMKLYQLFHLAADLLHSYGFKTAITVYVRRSNLQGRVHSSLLSVFCLHPSTVLNSDVLIVSGLTCQTF